MAAFSSADWRLGDSRLGTGGRSGTERLTHLSALHEVPGTPTEAGLTFPSPTTCSLAWAPPQGARPPPLYFLPPDHELLRPSFSVLLYPAIWFGTDAVKSGQLCRGGGGSKEINELDGGSFHRWKFPHPPRSSCFKSLRFLLLICSRLMVPITLSTQKYSRFVRTFWNILYKQLKYLLVTCDDK